MTLTIPDVAQWEPTKLTAAGTHANTVSTKLDGLFTKSITDTQALAWSGAAASAANTRMETEKTRASAVSAALLELKTAFDERVENLNNAKAKVIQLRDDALNQKPPFEVSDAGVVTATARIAEIRKADDRGGTEAAVLAEQLAAAQRQLDLTNALAAAEGVALVARTKVATAVAKLQAAHAGLGDPKLGVQQAPTAPATTQPPATTQQPANQSPSSQSPSNQSPSSNLISNTGTGSGTSKYSSDAPTTMPTGEQKEWIQKAIQELRAAGYDIDDSEAAIIAKIIEKESGGNPNAINLWDSNAAAGIPSKGLMQTIDPTFNSYKLPGHDDIYNPVDNIIAGTRYAIERYGSLSNVPGIAAMSQGGSYVGY
ncbi:transglycosylase SLT domain-containing protein [Nocardia goodfellowii]|uniref:Soluble lytic murein transglycosylase-like protein n=1 Tax=Nocardia goodfellowii TaxID=882446 RepID=A0ABS4QBE2_9NOCA|nr:transglycosylase SLT domain-containing protein [Nocardia goodfellowii]MBP2188893.1 soluble lytic murein transglycosylase-like protein [Nocardia goodfellowii]